MKTLYEKLKRSNERKHFELTQNTPDWIKPEEVEEMILRVRKNICKLITLLKK